MYSQPWFLRYIEARSISFILVLITSTIWWLWDSSSHSRQTAYFPLKPLSIHVYWSEINLDIWLFAGQMSLTNQPAITVYRWRFVVFVVFVSFSNMLCVTRNKLMGDKNVSKVEVVILRIRTEQLGCFKQNTLFIFRRILDYWRCLGFSIVDVYKAVCCYCVGLFSIAMPRSLRGTK
jgi:hypothetical protein